MSEFVNSIILSLNEYNELIKIRDKVQFDDTVVRMTNNYGIIHFYFVNKDEAVKELEYNNKCKDELIDILQKKITKLEAEVYSLNNKTIVEKKTGFWNLFKNIKI